MSLYDEVKQGSYKDAINQIAKKIDGLGENSGENIEYCQLAYSDANYDGSVYFAIEGDEYKGILFYCQTDYDIIIPLYITCLYGYTISSYIYGHIVSNDSSDGFLSVSGIMHSHSDGYIQTIPVLHYIGIKKGE